MADEPGRDETQETKGGGTGSPLKDLAKAESMVQLALAVPAGCFVGLLLGAWADRHFHQHWIVVVGMLVGAAAGFVQIFTVALGGGKGEAMSEGLHDFTDADLRDTMVGALRLLAVLAAAGAALFWWKRGWASGVLLLVGAGISAASLWEWARLMAAVNQRMDGGKRARPMGMVVSGFVLRLCLTLAVLYGSLKVLHGTVFAPAAGLGLAVLSLTIQALRLLRRWSV